jgi:ferredoxin-NADP reductase
MAYETWWVVHLYIYIALALAFSHQLATGAAFVGHPFARTFWTALWIGTGATVLCFRVLVPLARSLRHDLVLERVEHEGPGCVSLICRGRALERLRVAGGQFFHWRFLQRGLWWQAHPYSLSAMPTRSQLRLTVKDLGDHSAELSALKPGTRIAIEGPYGAFTKEAHTGAGVVLVGAGVGVTPVRALLEDLPDGTDVDVILRASTVDELFLRDEIDELVAQRAGRLHELVGPRDAVRLNADALLELVPDLAARDLYVCGPAGLAEAVIWAAQRAGVPANRIHLEDFAP